MVEFEVLERGYTRLESTVSAFAVEVLIFVGFAENRISMGFFLFIFSFQFFKFSAPLSAWILVWFDRTIQRISGMVFDIQYLHPLEDIDSISLSLFISISISISICWYMIVS